MDAGSYNLIFENPNGFQVINVVTLIPKKDWDEANKEAETIIEKFVVSNNRIPPSSNWHEVNFKMESPIRYEVTVPDETNWLIFTDTYNSQWVFKETSLPQTSKPIYSAVNGFYVAGTKQGEIIFEGQRYVRLGLYLSLGAVVILASIFIWSYSVKRGFSRNSKK